MAKEGVARSCGHWETVNLTGSSSDREYWRKREAAKLCRECDRMKFEERRLAANEAAANEAAAMEMPALIGSEKQIAWAQRLRMEWIGRLENGDSESLCAMILKHDIGALYEVLTSLRAQRRSSEEFMPAIAALLRPELIGWAGAQNQARWWIDNQQYIDRHAVKVYHEAALEALRALIHGRSAEEAFLCCLGLREEAGAIEAAQVKEKERIEREARAEATVIAKDSTSSFVARIVIKDATVEVDYPVREEDVNNILKHLGFAWDKPVWFRRASAPVHVAAQIGHLLLGAKTNILCYDPEIRRRAIAGEYEIEPANKIQVVSSGKYAGRLSVAWVRRDEGYDRLAKRLRGARWDEGRIVVPAENWEEVQDFASIHGFEWTKEAEEAAAAERAIMREALCVEVDPTEMSPMRIGEAPPILEIPESVVVASSLIDEE